MSRRKFLLGAALGILFSSSAVSQQGGGRGPQGPRVVSPEVLPDKKVTFRLLAPHADTVAVNGSWDVGTDIPMTKDDQGVWSATVGPLQEQLWWYSFRVDGIKVLDPGNAEYARDGNRYDNWLMISGGSPIPGNSSRMCRTGPCNRSGILRRFSKKRVAGCTFIRLRII
jgi:hypothetical protein